MSIQYIATSAIKSFDSLYNRNGASLRQRESLSIFKNEYFGKWVQYFDKMKKKHTTHFTLIEIVTALHDELLNAVFEYEGIIITDKKQLKQLAEPFNGKNGNKNGVTDTIESLMEEFFKQLMLTN